MKKIIFIILTVTMLFSSCYVTRTTVGNGPVGKDPSAQVYSSAKQMFLIAGIFPINNADPAKPADGNYQIKVSTNFWDAVVSSITWRIFDMRTVRVLVKKKSDK
jgi:hypothetical protein